MTAIAALPALSHRDQMRDDPLEDALKHNMGYIEFDVHLKNDQILIGHDDNDLVSKRTIESLYLDPLREKVISNGSLFQDGAILHLVVDIKTDASATFQKLQEIFSQYSDILTHYDKSGMHERSVSIIISGNRDKEAITNSCPRFAHIDGRLEDLDADDVDSTLMPIVSDSWTAVVAKNREQWNVTKVFKIFCCGRRTSSKTLCVIQFCITCSFSPRHLASEFFSKNVTPHIEKARQKGIKFRIWGIPYENPSIWKYLSDASQLNDDTMIFNTDKPDQMEKFLILSRERKV